MVVDTARLRKLARVTSRFERTRHASEKRVDARRMIVDIHQNARRSAGVDEETLMREVDETPEGQAARRTTRVLARVENALVALLNISEEQLEKHFLDHFVDARVRERTRRRLDLLRVPFPPLHAPYRNSPAPVVAPGRWRYEDLAVHRTLGLATLAGHLPDGNGRSGAIRSVADPRAQQDLHYVPDVYINLPVLARFDLRVLRRPATEDAADTTDAGIHVNDALFDPTSEVSVREQMETLRDDEVIEHPENTRQHRFQPRQRVPQMNTRHLVLEDAHSLAKARRTQLSRHVFREHIYCMPLLAHCAVLLFRQVCPAPARLDVLRGAKRDAITLTFPCSPTLSVFRTGWVGESSQWADRLEILDGERFRVTRRFTGDTVVALPPAVLSIEHPPVRNEQRDDAHLNVHTGEMRAYTARLQTLAARVHYLVERALAWTLHYVEDHSVQDWFARVLRKPSCSLHTRFQHLLAPEVVHLYGQKFGVSSASFDTVDDAVALWEMRVGTARRAVVIVECEEVLHPMTGMLHRRYPRQRPGVFDAEDCWLRRRHHENVRDAGVFDVLFAMPRDGILIFQMDAHSQPAVAVDDMVRPDEPFVPPRPTGAPDVRAVPFWPARNPDAPVAHADAIPRAHLVPAANLDANPLADALRAAVARRG